MRTSWGSATDRGLVREVNEDALLAYPPVFLVADGMGGHDAGDLASRIAVEEFAQLAGQAAATADDVHACFDRTAARIRTEFTGGRQGGTTVAGVAVTEHDGGSYWLVFNVGDSRVYLWSGDTLEQVSVDHSVVQELLDLGEIDLTEAATHPERHVLTRALGTGDPPEPEYWLLPAGLTDRLLICTDGLTREVSDDDLAHVLAETADPQDAAAHLVRLALDHGARDNVSAVVVDVATAAGAHDDVHITVPRTGAALGPHVWDEMLNGATVPRRSRTATKPIPRVTQGPSTPDTTRPNEELPVMSVPEYFPGEWTAVVRPGLVALLGPGAAESTVRALWQDTGEGVFAALALLARDGFGGLPPFAVVSVDGRRVHAALRGDVEVVVDVDGRQDVWRSGEVSTWTERVLDGVADVVVQADGAPTGGASMPLADGVAAASRVLLALTAREVSEPATAPATNPVGVEPVAVEPVVAEPAEPVALAQVADEQVAEEPVVPSEDVPEPVAAPAQEQHTEIVDVAPWHTPAPDPDPTPAPAGEIVDAVSWDEPTEVELVPLSADGPDEDPDAGTDGRDPSGVVAAAESFLTSPFTPRGADQAASPLPVGGASLDDHDGLTILSTDLAEIREQLPSWASDEVPGPFRTPVAAAQPARLVLSTGLVVPLDRAVLLGRAPQVARVTNRELPRLITVPSPQQDISRTHAEVRVEGEHVVVTDLDSTNGIHVSRSGEGARRLHPGEPSVVGVDEVVDLGDGVTFSVERGS